MHYTENDGIYQSPISQIHHYLTKKEKSPFEPDQFQTE